MDDRAWVATRKGLFEMRQRGGEWRVERCSFVGEPVSMLLPPDADGRMLAALNLGHFGVKLHASDDAGASWHEVDAPALPDWLSWVRLASTVATSPLPLVQR